MLNTKSLKAKEKDTFKRSHVYSKMNAYVEEKKQAQAETH